MSKLIDLCGKQFFRWTVIRYLPDAKKWECRCECGTVRAVDGNNMRSGKTRSCGLCVDTSGENNPLTRSVRRRHGSAYVGKKSPWYTHAASIFGRCRGDGIRIGFSSIHELASYLMEIAPERCPILGVAFSRGNRGFSPWGPSVDRIESAIGYVRGNLQVISMKANAMKNSASPSELKSFARWVMHGDGIEPGTLAGLVM